jgi:hypothetical protein
VLWASRQSIALVFPRFEEVVTGIAGAVTAIGIGAGCVGVGAAEIFANEEENEVEAEACGLPKLKANEMLDEGGVAIGGAEAKLLKVEADDDGQALFVPFFVAELFDFPNSYSDVSQR